MRTIPDIGHLLTTLENVIHREFIPSLSSWPARLGWLCLTNPTAFADCFFQISIKQTKMLVNFIVSQQLSGDVDLEPTLSAIQQASDLGKFLDQRQKGL